MKPAGPVVQIVPIVSILGVSTVDKQGQQLVAVRPRRETDAKGTSAIMKRICLAVLLTTIALSSTGCCLFDKLFCCPRGYPIGPGGCGSGCGSGCGPCGPACGPCGGGCGPACGYNSGPRHPSCCDCDCTQGGPPPGYYGQQASYGPQGNCGQGNCAQGNCGPGGYCGQPGYGGQPIGGQGRSICANRFVPANSGPPTGAITYPYYTTRGPRDFLAANPGSIGP
jgi:hypothetical protein